MRAPSTSIRLALCVAVFSPACDDEAEPPQQGKGEEQSRESGEAGAAQTAPGEMLEKGKAGVEAAEKKLEARDAKILEAAQGEKVERGQMP